MKFIDDNFVSSVVLHERGLQGVQLTWSCIPSRRDYQVEGFLICYMTAEFSKECCNELEQIGDEALLRKVRNNQWIFKDSKNLKVGSVSRNNLAEGFQALNEMFKAPCQIRIWTVVLDSNNELLIMNETKPECISYRKIPLRRRVDSVDIEAKTKRGLFGRVIGVTPEEHYAKITISLGDYNDSYIEGSIEYRVPGCKYPFPVSKEMLGKEIRIEGTSRVEIRPVNGFEEIYILG